MSSPFQAFFSQPVVATAVIVHLVTDGTYYGDQKQETISVQLLDTKEQSHDLGKHVLLSWLIRGTCFHASAVGGCEHQFRMSSSFPFCLSCFFTL